MQSCARQYLFRCCCGNDRGGEPLTSEVTLTSEVFASPCTQASPAEAVEQFVDPEKAKAATPVEELSLGTEDATDNEEGGKKKDATEDGTDNKEEGGKEDEDEKKDEDAKSVP